MRRTPDHETGCANKVKYKNRGAARKAADKGKHYDTGNKRHLEPYRCPFCKSWHIGKARHRGGGKLRPFDRSERYYTKSIMVKLRHGKL